MTHLPQVAAFGDAHFQVSKKPEDGRTVSQVELLDADSVERELAAMSVGEGADAKATLAKVKSISVVVTKFRVVKYSLIIECNCYRAR